MIKNIALIGYSGHSYVACEILQAQGFSVTAYVGNKASKNPYKLAYLGLETEANVVVELAQNFNYFIGIGNNTIREKLQELLSLQIGNPVNAIHPTSIISPTSTIGHGCMIGANVVINPQVTIANGVICNTGAIIEHECRIGNYSHISPGAVLCGNVQVGHNSFIGANAVIKQNIIIGNNVTIGAGAVVINNIANNEIMVGNPQKSILK